MTNRSLKTHLVYKLIPIFILSLITVLFFQNCGGGFEGQVEESSTAGSNPFVVGNLAPSAAITAPANNSSFASGTAITISADASDPDGSIARVEFFINGSMANSDTTSPYSYVVNNLAVGSHSVYVRAYDNVGGYATTASRTVRVTAVSNDPLANCSFSTYRLPSWVDSSPVSINYSVGLGDGGPAISDIIQNHGYNNGTRNVIEAIEARTAGNSDIEIDFSLQNNQVRTVIGNADNVECVSGSVTYTATLSDGCPNKVFPSKTFTINYTNVCPSQNLARPTLAQTQAAFGSRVAVDGNYLVASSPGHDDSGRSNVGAGLVFFNNNGSWSEQQLLIPSSAVSNAGILGVAIRGNLVALGAPGVSGVAGRVYVYERVNSTWNLISTINQPTAIANPNDYLIFGYRVEILADQSIVVSAPGEDVNASAVNAGAVYVYSRSGNTWSQVNKLTASPLVAGESFGFDISARNTILAIGAPVVANSESTNFFGSVYLFSGSASTYTQSRRIKLASTTSIMQFGSSVHTDGSRVAVGVPLNNSRRGGVYVFDVASGVQVGSIIQSNDIVVDDRFGAKVQIEGNTLWASSPGDENSTGAIYRFNLSGTASQNFKLRSRQAERAAGAQFGQSFLWQGSQIAVGSPARMSNNQNNAGLGFIIGNPP